MVRSALSFVHSLGGGETSGASCYPCSAMVGLSVDASKNGRGGESSGRGRGTGCPSPAEPALFSVLRVAHAVALRLERRAVGTDGEPPEAVLALVLTRRDDRDATRRGCQRRRREQWPFRSFVPPRRQPPGGLCREAQHCARRWRERPLRPPLLEPVFAGEPSERQVKLSWQRSSTHNGTTYRSLLGPSRFNGPRRPGRRL